MMATLLELAKRWNRSSLVLTKAERKVFPLGPATQDEIITTNRLILILHGKLDYTVEGKRVRMEAGTQFFVPAWIRRVWSVPRGGPCEIIWCEFDGGGAESGWTGCVRRKLDKAEFQRETMQYRKLLKRYASEVLPGGEWKHLEMEAELKCLLLRFLGNAALPQMKAGSGKKRGRRLKVFHPRVKVMLKWLGDHYADEQVLERLYGECGMTRNYFRKLFTEAMQCAPHVYIERLRLRHARYLLHESDRPVKQIAGECGYGDALYFSRIYHRFWGHPPVRERSGRRQIAF